MVDERAVEAGAQALAAHFSGWSWTLARWRIVARLVLDAAEE